jgi:glycosyltransferase involved in cell wall biosynthesis
MKLLFLVNWKEEGKWDTYIAISRKVGRIDILQPYWFGASPNSWLNRLSRILAEFYLPFLAIVRGKGFDVVVAWSMRMGTICGILNRFLRKASSPKHIIYDFHINMIRSDPGYRLRLMLLRMAIPGIDFFLCTSERERVLYSDLFDIPLDRMGFYPITAPRKYLQDYSFPRRNYLLAYGNSDRDYETLVEALKHLDFETVILSQTYKPREQLPPHVTLITESRVGLDLVELIVSSRLVVLPLKDYRIAAGQTAMLETMALGRPLIITANLATLEYARHLETALFHRAGDSKDLEKLIRLLMGDLELAERIGSNARTAFRLSIDWCSDTFIRILTCLQDRQPRRNPMIRQ